MFCQCTMHCLKFLFLHLRADMILVEIGHILYFLFRISYDYLDNSFISSFLHREKKKKIFPFILSIYFLRGLDEYTYGLTPWCHSVLQENLSSPLLALRTQGRGSKLLQVLFFCLISAFLTNLVCLNCFFSFCLPCSQAQASPSFIFDRCLFSHGNFLSCLLFWKDV